MLHKFLDLFEGVQSINKWCETSLEHLERSREDNREDVFSQIRQVSLFLEKSWFDKLILLYINLKLKLTYKRLCILYQQFTATLPVLYTALHQAISKLHLLYLYKTFIGLHEDII
jgi:hypothetical protein